MPTRRPTGESLDTTQRLHILRVLRQGEIGGIRLPRDGSDVCGKVAHVLHDLIAVPVATALRLAHLCATGARP